MVCLASPGTRLEACGTLGSHPSPLYSHTCRLAQSCVSAGGLLVEAVVVLSVAAGEESSPGGLGSWWMPSVSCLTPCIEPTSSTFSSSTFSSSTFSSSSFSSSSFSSPSPSTPSPSSSSAKGSCRWSSGAAVVSSSPCSCRRLSRLFRSFLSFCSALHSLSSSSSFPCRALKWPSRRVFYNKTQCFIWVIFLTLDQAVGGTYWMTK